MGARLFGASVQRLEDARLVTGRGRYVDDIHPAGVVHAAFVRSSLAHGLIQSIDTSVAQTMPGVLAVYVMSDFAAFASGPLPQLAPHPLIQGPITYEPLASREVRHVGEAIAMVLATSRAEAEDAAERVILDIEPLPVAADLAHALDPDAPKARSERADNRLATLKTAFGDVAGTFARADHVLKETFTVHRGGCHSMETRGVIATFDADDRRLEMWTSSQSPYLVRRNLASYFGLDESAVRVRAPDVGGGFGPKAAVYPEEAAVALAAMMTGKPVKWIEDRSEHFLATTQQRDQIWELEVAASNDGRLLGVRGRCLHDNGAYAPYGAILPATALGSFPGPYALEALDISIDIVLTNLVPTTPVRGASRPSVAFVLERLADRVARHLGLPREDIRRRSFIRVEQMPYVTGTKARDGSPISYDSGDYTAALNLVLDKIDADGFAARRAEAASRGKLLGLGLASCVEDTGLGPFEGATVRVSSRGRVIVTTGAASQGQGHQTTLAQIAADALGVSLDDVSVEAADSGKFPLGISTIASRVAVTAGSSVELAAQQVRRKALKTASHLLEAAEDDLEIENGVVFVKGASDVKVTLATLAQSLAGTAGMRLPGGIEPDLAATAYFESTALTFAHGSNACEVEVDPETGHVRITRYVVAHDCGRLINPLIVDGQIRGGVIHGIGNALYERMIHDDQGQPLTATYADYLLPMASEMPNIEIYHLESPSPRNPLGVKGAGEGGTIPAAACVISAIEDAIGPGGTFVRHHPISFEEVAGLIDTRTI